MKLNMKVDILLMMTFFAASNGEETDPEECGKAVDGSRIFGGNKTCEGCIPWQISLQLKEKIAGSNWRHFCGGSIISSKLVITATHCFLNLMPTVEEVVAAAEIKVYAGVTDYTNELTMKLDIKRIHIPPDYQGPPLAYANDYAILELTQPINFGKGSKVQAVCLPTKEEVEAFKDGTQLVASGWGLGNEPKNILRHIEIPFVSDSECKSALKKRLDEPDQAGQNYTQNQIDEELNQIVNPTVICAGITTIDNINPRICSGDSGGPLTWKDKKTSKFKLIGVTSFTQAGRDEATCKKYNIPEKYWNKEEDGKLQCCLPGYPQGWADVSVFLDMIHNAMKGDFNQFNTTTVTTNNESTTVPTNNKTTTIPTNNGSTTFAGMFLTIGIPVVMSYIWASQKISLMR